jgi:UrcA family protein
VLKEDQIVRLTLRAGCIRGFICNFTRATRHQHAAWKPQPALKRRMVPYQFPGVRIMKSLSHVTTVPARMPALLAAALFAVGGLGLFSASAQAADLDQITISAPSVKTVGHDYATGAPIEEMTATGQVKVDPVTLTTNSGVALLNDAVQAAAQKICYSLDPLSFDDGECVRGAIKSAQGQVAAAVARARANTVG